MQFYLALGNYYFHSSLNWFIPQLTSIHSPVAVIYQTLSSSRSLEECGLADQETPAHLSLYLNRNFFCRRHKIALLGSILSHQAPVHTVISLFYACTA
jgi:hypothetical protein